MGGSRAGVLAGKDFSRCREGTVELVVVDEGDPAFRGDGETPTGLPGSRVLAAADALDGPE